MNDECQHQVCADERRFFCFIFLSITSIPKQWINNQSKNRWITFHISVKVGGMRVVQHKNTSSSSSTEESNLEDVTGLTVIWMQMRRRNFRGFHSFFVHFIIVDGTKHHTKSEIDQRCTRYWECSIFNECGSCVTAHWSSSETCATACHPSHQSAQQTMICLLRTPNQQTANDNCASSHFSSWFFDSNGSNRLHSKFRFNRRNKNVWQQQQQQQPHLRQRQIIFICLSADVYTHTLVCIS